ncbi:MAG: glycosyltransferase family 9 protein [Bacteroidia bacterium]
MRVLVSRTDNLGDVILTLPLCGILKEKYQAEIYFLAQAAWAPLLAQCRHIDGHYDEITACPKVDVILHVYPRAHVAYAAWKKKIPLRIGSAHRWYHWLWANRLVFFSRRRSFYHEAYLNLFLLQPLGISPGQFLLSSLHTYYGLQAPQVNPPIPLPKPFIVLHPYSRGSAPRWPVERFAQLSFQIEKLGYTPLVTGSPSEKAILEPYRAAFSSATVWTVGKLSLTELMYVLSQSAALVAGSTGPLHLAASLGRPVVGLFASTKPLFPARWGPLGQHATFLTGNVIPPGQLDIPVSRVYQSLEILLTQK